jgi:hypothetical protein
MPVGAVVRDDVDDRPYAVRVAIGDQRVGIGQGAEGGVDGTVVRDVVSGVGLRGLVPGGEPDRVDAERRQVGQPVPDAGQVTQPVTVAVGEALHVQLVDGGMDRISLVCGMVMCRILRYSPAPSSSAASYSSPGMFCSAAR